MTLEQLKNYRSLVIEICDLEEKLEVLDAKLTQTTKSLSSMPRNRTPKDITNDLLAEHADVHTTINTKLCSAAADVMIITEGIQALEEPAKSVYRLRYLEGKTWDVIAAELSYSRMQVYRIHNGVELD